jgi:methyl-accepting chemotaxis protein
MQSAARDLVADAAAAHEQIQGLFVAFQYQDRVNQVLTLVRQDLERLQSMLDQPGHRDDQIDPAAWLAELEKRYAMEEQRSQSPAGTSAARGGKSAPAAAPAPTETTFF